jgi:hypothetical protein
MVVGKRDRHGKAALLPSLHDALKLEAGSLEAGYQVVQVAVFHYQGACPPLGVRLDMLL